MRRARSAQAYAALQVARLRQQATSRTSTGNTRAAWIGRPSLSLAGAGGFETTRTCSSRASPAGKRLARLRLAERASVKGIRAITRAPPGSTRSRRGCGDVLRQDAGAPGQDEPARARRLCPDTAQGPAARSLEILEDRHERASTLARASSRSSSGTR